MRAFLAQAHDRAFAELLLDLADGQFDGLHFFAILAVVRSGSFGVSLGGLAFNK